MADKDTSGYKMRPPEVCPAEFARYGYARFQTYSNALSPFMVASGYAWTLITNKDARLDDEGNPFSTANTPAGRKGREQHKRGQAFLLAALNAFSKVPKASSLVAQFQIEHYNTKPAYDTGENYCVGTELLQALRYKFAPSLQGEQDNAIELFEMTIKNFPGLIHSDAVKGGPNIEKWAENVRTSWSALEPYDGIAAMEPALFRKLRSTLRIFCDSSTNRQGLNKAYEKIYTDARLIGADNEKITTFIDVLEDQIRIWCQDYVTTSTTVKALATASIGGPCAYCNGPNHNISECNKLKALKANSDIKALGHNHNPLKVRFNKNVGRSPNFKSHGARDNHGGNYGSSSGRTYSGHNARNNNGGNRYGQGNPYKRPNYAPPGHPYRGKHYDPTKDRGIMANNANARTNANAMLHPPHPQFPAPPPPPYSHSYGGNSSDLTNILNANLARPLSINHILISPEAAAIDNANYNEPEPVSSPDLPAYEEITSDDDDMDLDKEIEALGKDNNADDETLSMTSEQLDEAHDIFLASSVEKTIKLTSTLPIKEWEQAMAAQERMCERKHQELDAPAAQNSAQANRLACEQERGTHATSPGVQP